MSLTYTFHTTSISHGCFNEVEGINWSPDGSRVTMTDDLDDQIVIWRFPAQT